MARVTSAAGGRASGWHRRVWAIAVPMMLANVTVPLLNAVDTGVMGHQGDAAYIGAVGIGSVIFAFVYWGFGFLRMGTTGFTAQAFGAEDAAELRAALARPLLLAFALGALLIVLQAPIGWLAFALFDASDQVEDLAQSYYAIRIWSAPAALANYAMIGWLLGTRRAGAVLLIQVVLNGINIVLDLVFVVGLGWGVEGVALASLLAELSAVVLGLAVVARALAGVGGVWDWPRIVARERLVVLLRANLDILVRTLCLVVAFAYFTARSATMGDVLLAGNAILLQLQGFTAYGLDGFAHAVEVLAGNALGARSRPAFREAVRVSTLWALGTAGAMTGLYLVLGAPIIALFTDIEAVRRAAEAYLPWVIIAPLVSVWSFQLDGIFIGTTRTRDMRNAMVLSLAIYLGACWILVPALANHGLWLAYTILMIARAGTLGWLYPRLENSVGSDGVGGLKR